MTSVMKESCTPTVAMPMIKQVEYYFTRAKRAYDSNDAWPRLFLESYDVDAH